MRMMAVDELDIWLQRQIAAARCAMGDLVARTPERWWTPFELKKSARNGWSASIMGLAFYELLDGGELEQGTDLRVRVKRPAHH